MKKTIKELEASLEAMNIDMENCLRDLNHYKEKISDILSNETIDLYFSNKSGYGYTWEKIIEEIIKLKTRVKSEGQSESEMNYTLRQENAKLWYMIRVAMGDKGREEPINAATSKSKFEEPNF